MVRPVPALALTTLLAACSATPTEPPVVQALQTSATAYVAARVGPSVAVEIPVILANALPDDITIANCAGSFGQGLQRLEGGVWQTAWGNGVPSCASQPIIVPPNGRFADTVLVTGFPPGAAPSPSGFPPLTTGTYRVVFPAGEIVRGRDTNGRPLGAVVSNAFTLVVP